MKNFFTRGYRIGLIVFAGLMCSGVVSAQIRQDISMGGGMVLGFCDIGNLGYGTTLQSAWMFSPNRDLKVLAVLNTGWLTGSDTGTDNEARDYAFSSLIVEPSIQLHINFVRIWGRGYDHMGHVIKEPLVSIFITTGVSPVFFKPTAKKSFVTGYDRDYFHFSYAIPGGLGARYVLNSRYALEFSFQARMLQSDYLDGYTSAYSEANDMYYTGILSLTYRLPTKGERFR